MFYKWIMELESCCPHFIRIFDPIFFIIHHQTMHLLRYLLPLLLLSAPLSAQDLSFATFNCEFLLPQKVHMKYGFRYDGSNLPKNWERQQQFEQAVDTVAAYLAALNADVLGLTEVGDQQAVQVLAKALQQRGMDYRYLQVGASQDTETGQHVAILSKYPLSDVVPVFPNRGLYYTESDYDEVEETGISKGMKAAVTAKGHTFQVFVFHLKSERGGEESDQKRLMQAEIARRVTLPFLNQGEKVVIMGDLNVEKRHPVLLTLRGFKDIGEELIQTGDTYFFKDLSTRWTYNYKGQYEQLDHILLSLNIRDLCHNNNYRNDQWGIQTQIVPVPSELVSDHNAVLVKLYFK